MRCVLVQPDAGSRISGGYLYNAHMAAHGAWELENLKPHELGRVADLDVDLVIADSIWLTEADFAPFFALKAKGRRVAVMLHSFPSMIRAAESGASLRVEPTPFEREALSRVGLVFVPGPHYASMLHGCDVRVLSPGIDDGFRAPPRARRGPCTLVSVGAVTPRKGFRDAVEALRGRAGTGDFRYLIVGSLEVDAAYAESVRELVRDVCEMELVGQMPPAEVRELIKGADVLVMPSYDENHPLVVLEAIAASVPVVAYAAGHTAHMLAHEREGLVGPVGDRATLATHLTRLIEREDERKAMADACWQKQAHIPSWAQAAERARAQLA